MNMPGRRKPYTAIGIRRVNCVRHQICGNKAQQQWSICADGNKQRPLCNDCDIELNRMVLTWAMFPDVEALMAAYREKMACTSD